MTRVTGDGVLIFYVYVCTRILWMCIFIITGTLRVVAPIFFIRLGLNHRPGAVFFSLKKWVRLLKYKAIAPGKVCLSGEMTTVVDLCNLLCMLFLVNL